MIAILCPSRGRPDRFAEMVQAVRQTADAPDDIVIYVGLDEDDYEQYELPLDVRCLIRPRMRLAAWTNLLARQALADGYRILGFLGDDHRPRTKGWDTRIRDAAERLGSGLVYCTDGLQNERLPTAPFWTADVIRALGWYYPPQLVHLYADDYWLRLARDLGRCVYLPDVLIEHMHHSNGKAEKDESYAESETFTDRDREAFEQLMIDGDHASNLARVRAAL